VEFTGKLFSCPRCGKETLLLHKKTYEPVTLASCSNCRFNSSFEPSKEAYYDLNKAWEELIANYKRARTKNEIFV